MCVDVCVCMLWMYLCTFHISTHGGGVGGDGGVVVTQQKSL